MDTKSKSSGGDGEVNADVEGRMRSARTVGIDFGVKGRVRINGLW